MPVLISGILKDGAGKAVQGCSIHLKAIRTSPTVVMEITSSDITGPDGSYRIEAEPGYYKVMLQREGFDPIWAGEIYVAPTDAPDTLNAFLDAPKDGDLRPEVMKRFEEMVNRTAALCLEAERDRERAEQAAQSAEQSQDSAALSATAAAESQAQAARSADAADVSARSADDNARQTAQDALSSSADADSAAKSAQTATEQAGAAKTAADTAQKAQQSAGASAQSAAGSAESAASSAQTAGKHAGNAAASETSARESALTATQAAEQGAASAQAAASSERAAHTSADNAATSEQNAETSAGESENSAEESAESARQAGQHKDEAALSAQAAKSSEDAAAKSAKEAAGTLAGALMKENNLSEFAGASDEVLNQLYANLKLGAAAKSDIQRNIYDRAEGRLPVQNSFGFGRVFTSEETVSITEKNTFDYWIKYAYPGRYRVHESGITTISGVVFSGVVDVIWTDVSSGQQPEYNVKLIYFSGVNGNLYMNRYWTASGGYLIGWENLKQEVLPFGAVRTYALMSWNKAVEFQSGGLYPGAVVPGASLVWANIPGPGETQELSTYPKGPAGSWRVLARLTSATQTALFYRFA